MGKKVGKMEKKISNVALIRFRTLVLRGEGRGSKRKLRELSFLSDIDILTLPLRIMISSINQIKISVIWGALDTNTGVQRDTVPKYSNPVNFHIKSPDEVLNILKVYFNLTLASNTRIAGNRGTRSSF